MYDSQKFFHLTYSHCTPCGSFRSRCFKKISQGLAKAPRAFSPRTASDFISLAIFVTFVISLPVVVEARVLINEIAWMGTEGSHNDEWIELYNDGTRSVSVDGWKLTDGGSLVIELAGALGAGEYAVLERTDDNSAPSPAFLIYKGALSNQGRTLTLVHTNGEIEDEVEGGTGWELVGGSNETKETAQRIAEGWQTAPASPGEENMPLPPPEPEAAAVALPAQAFNSEPVMLAEVVAAEGTERQGIQLPYYGFVALLVVAILALYTRGRNNIDGSKKQ